MPRKKPDVRSRRVFLNAGCGTSNGSRLPRFFRGWRQIRVDVDPSLEPDLVASVADLSALPDGSVNAVWSAHCIEHLFAYEVPLALAEFRRVLSSQGFACIVVPDLQAIAHWIADDRLHETIYQSAAGPVTAQDMVWGFGPAIANGKTAMAHRCGFTPTVFLEYLKAAGFSEIVLRRRSGTLELAGLALQRQSKSSNQREKLMTELGL
ncbi:MAG TPA: methyltransferase domain-containing protein [Candidatus Sulfotelmatobacter sp.]|jgi:SAM-dependent methyltransferase|nr:methyltransferase domain-containing protein [Candidatus Sulfotelmatobacter sp.]